MNLLKLIGRSKPLLQSDLEEYRAKLNESVKSSSFLVIGGAGSIGQAVTKEIFERNPLKLHVVDLSENNLVELVRDIRSSFGYISGDFRTFALDCGSETFDIFMRNEGPYDYVLNLSALKHVRSERDPYTLMRMVETNILNVIKTIDLAIDTGAKKYFCVSTDKAANPVNMMGASKRIMEMFLIDRGSKINISTARFANVAFSDGSLLHGFNQRILKNQPLAAPNDVRRYFVTPKEAGLLCLMSTILGKNRDIFFPKLDQDLNLITFSDIAERFLATRGFTPLFCSSEEEARQRTDLIYNKQWPCFFSGSDTSGEKDYEEFYTENEDIDLQKFHNLGIVVNSSIATKEQLNAFLDDVDRIRKGDNWTKSVFVDLFVKMVPGFCHVESSKDLDQKM